MPWTANFADGLFAGDSQLMEGPQWQRLWFTRERDHWDLLLVGDTPVPRRLLPPDTIEYVRDEHLSMLEPPDVDGPYQGSAVFTAAKTTANRLIATAATGSGKTHLALADEVARTYALGFAA